MASPSATRADRPQRWRAWLQFSLLSLLFLVVLVSLSLSWVRVRMNRARQQREATETLGKIRCHGGGEYGCAYDDPATLVEERSAAPQWLRSVLGDDFFTTVYAAILEYSEATDTDLRHLTKLIGLETVALDGTPITDAGLEHLYEIHSLREVYLEDTQVTDDGVRKLQEALPHLQVYR